MTNWITDEWGNFTFTHEGWTVRIWFEGWTVTYTLSEGWTTRVWSPEHSWNRISVESPHCGEEVEVNEEGIWVNGQSSGCWEGPGPNAFTIPWAVIGAIIEARRIVG